MDSITIELKKNITDNKSEDEKFRDQLYNFIESNGLIDECVDESQKEGFDFHTWIMAKVDEIEKQKKVDESDER